MLSKLPYFLLFIILISCSNEAKVAEKETDSPPENPANSTLPASNGGRLDLIVVSSNSVWDGVAGEAIRKVFSAAQHGLPQEEPLFNVIHIESSKFNYVLKRSRNIIVLEINPENIGSKLQENAWADPQIVAYYSAADQNGIAELFKNSKERVFEEFMALEISTMHKRLKKGRFLPNPKVLQDHGVSMDIPRSFELDQENENLLVFWNKTIKTDQGIIIHFSPLNDEDLTVGSNTIPLRDSITKLYIHGQKEGSYMKTEMLIPPKVSTLELSGQFALETRGLWKTIGEFKGGPFINYTIYDEKNKQVIFLDAFIYSPETKKRNFLLELETVLRSLKIK
tara:strand:+ start:603 stop:1616 length:1014 start_codon:yes stop_codon:yes gene_type:complete